MWGEGLVIQIYNNGACRKCICSALIFKVERKKIHVQSHINEQFN